MNRIIMPALLIVSTVLASVGLSHTAPPPLSDDGLVGHWTFQEGAGDVLGDRSGNDNHGKIHGAKWVRDGDVNALEFDGVDDHVDCGDGPSLDLRDSLSMIAWVYPEKYVRGEPGIIGKAYESYVITHYSETVFGYISGGPYNTSAAMTHGRWHHVASTYDGKTIKIYVDGVLASVNALGKEVPKGGHFWMARSDGELRYTKDKHFRGKIAEARVYNRVLRPEEIALHARTSHLTGKLALVTTPLPWRDTLIVEVDRRGLGPLPHPLKVRVNVFRLDANGRPRGRPVLRGALTEFDARGSGVLVLPAPKLAAGRYQAVATAVKSWGRKIGKPGTHDLSWEPPSTLPPAPAGTRRLNAFVLELINVPGTVGWGVHTFTNPRKGWIFIANRGADAVTLTHKTSGRTQIIPLVTEYQGAHEAMRHLEAGDYTLATGAAKDLVVRAIPELCWARFGSNPIVTEFGSFQGDFQKNYILPHVNTFVGASERSYAWRKRTGGRILSHGRVLYGTPEKPLTVEAAADYITSHGSFKSADIDGLIADEFGGSDPICRIWGQAVDKVLSQPEHAPKLYYPYSGTLWNGPDGLELVDAVAKHDCKVPWERYLKEQRTELDAWRYLAYHLIDPVKELRQKRPQALPHLMVTFGFFSAPPETLDAFPNVNYMTWLDMQFNLVANHPDFDGLGGLMTYLANYTDEETVRWTAMLFRHYGIEGNTRPFTAAPYLLHHVDNPDFERGADGWTVRPAEEKSITFGTRPGFGWLQGRYPKGDEGDSVLITKRSADKPNVFSQQIKGLQPGRLYALRMFSGDYNDLSLKHEHALAIRLDDVEITQSFTHINANCYSHHHGPFNAKNKAWMNYHWRVFRAKSRTATLTISDWATDQKPGGPIGQQLMFNFVQIQPYYPLTAGPN